MYISPRTSISRLVIESAKLINLFIIILLSLTLFLREFFCYMKVPLHCVNERNNSIFRAALLALFMMQLEADREIKKYDVKVYRSGKKYMDVSGDLAWNDLLPFIRAFITIRANRAV